MQAIDPILRAELGKRLDQESQEAVMKDIEQFTGCETGFYAASAPDVASAGSFQAMVFNIERGVHLQETIDFLKYCPSIKDCGVILANELDDGCLRSGGHEVAKEIAEALGLNYVFGLEFIELKNFDEPKGYHGNAIFTPFPILWSETFRLPEENNWYFDNQRRIGGRCAIFAKLDIGGRELGVVSIHLENRTDGAGRRRQMKAIMDEVDQVFAGIPVLLGGDLNTNTFDGRSVPAIEFLQNHPHLLEEQLRQMTDYEPCLPDAAKRGYNWLSAATPDDSDGQIVGTRRKPLPGDYEMLLRLDWLLPRGLKARSGKTLSTLTADCDFAPVGSALAKFDKKEISDHNAVIADFSFED